MGVISSHKKSISLSKKGVMEENPVEESNETEQLSSSSGESLKADYVKKVTKRKVGKNPPKKKKSAKVGEMNDDVKHISLNKKFYEPVQLAERENMIQFIDDNTSADDVDTL
jgi:hypothetical protein